MGNRKEEDYCEEDLARIRQVTQSGIHSTERQPFRPLRLLFILWVVVSILGGASYFLAKLEGVI